MRTKLVYRPRLLSLLALALLIFALSHPINPIQAQTPIPGALIKAINAGGGASGSYVADTNFDIGNQYSDTSTAIDTSGDPNPAPQAVYQTCRWNAAFTYTVPGLTAGTQYIVRLHWAELTWQAAGQRKFNVAINGVTVLSAFDVFAAGGYKKAVARTFTSVANSSGQIVIAFSQGGADNPFISGIEILSVSTATAIPTSTAVSGDGQPWGGTAVSLPGKVEAENFNTGGESVAYHDNDVANQGGQYRTGEGVDIENTGDTGGGVNVGWTNGGEWMKYTVRVTTAGTYSIDFRVASPNTGSVFHLEVDGTNVTGTMTIPNTGGWQTWTTVTKTGVALSAGQHVLRFYEESGGFNLNWLSVNNGTSATATPIPTNTPVPTFVPPTATFTSIPPTATQGAGTVVKAINAGGGTSGSYVADTNFDTGNQFSDTSSAIDTSADPNPAPQTVYQTCRWNASFSYTIPGLTAGATYTVRLHWAELTWQAVGQRKFNVAINGVTVLSAFDVFAAGGYKRAIARSLTTTANGSGQIVIAFSQAGADNPFISGIEIVSGTTPTPTPTTVVSPTVTPTSTPGNNGVIGNTIVGYQGWFAAAGDGSTFNSWFHWSNGGVPGPGNLKFELYPDVREYTTLFQTNFANLGNGSPAKLFSSYTTQTIDLHFQWMKANNIDGAALQRFGTDVLNPSMKSFRDSVATKLRNAAETNGRTFYIMYDVSGMGSTFVTDLENDWTNTIVPMNLTASPMYARQNGKPVVCIWGVGFSDRPGTPSDWTTLINWFKGQGVYVIGGAPADWRTSGPDLKTGFDNVWPLLNMIQPWTVGRYGTDADVDNYKNNTLIPDRDYTAQHGMDYQPVAFPGFAWSNWNGGTRNQIPRRQGNLFWRQVYNIKGAGISTLYIAMFDEYDEGTAIAKAAEDSSMIPTNQYFLTLDADGTHLSSDFYLRLAGAANRMLKGQIPLSLTIPIPNQ